MSTFEPCLDIEDLRRALLFERYGPMSLAELERGLTPAQLERRRVLTGEDEPAEEGS